MIRSRSAWLEKAVDEEEGAGLSFDRRIRRPAFDGGDVASVMVRWAVALPARGIYRRLRGPYSWRPSWVRLAASTKCRRRRRVRRRTEHGRRGRDARGPAAKVRWAALPNKKVKFFCFFNFVLLKNGKKPGSMLQELSYR